MAKGMCKSVGAALAGLGLCVAFAGGAAATPVFGSSELGGGAHCTFASAPLSPGDAGLVGVSAATDCIRLTGGPGGNTTLQMMIDDSAFEMASWSFEDKANLPALVSLGGYLNITVNPDSNSVPSGTWSLADGFAFPVGESFALALKGGPSSITYLLNPAFTFGTWSMADITNPGGQNPGLSNITLFGTAAVAPIPLPAPVLLLLGALGGLAIAARRRRSRTA